MNRQVRSGDTTYRMDAMSSTREMLKYHRKRQTGRAQRSIKALYSFGSYTPFIFSLPAFTTCYHQIT